MVNRYISNFGELSVLENKDSVICYDRKIKKWLTMNKDLEEILLLCQGKLSLAQIIKNISRKYNLPENEIREAVLQTVKSLEKDRIITKREKEEDKSIKLRKYFFQFPLISAFVEITKQCNLSCLHCYNDSSSFQQGDLSRDFFYDFLEQADEIGVFNIFFTGGEPFVRSDFMEMLHDVHNKGLETGILTNGTMLNSKRIRELTEINPKFIGVSLESIDPAKYKKIRGIDNTKIIKNILKMKEAGLNVRINTVLFNGLNDNYEDMKQLLLFFKERGFNQKDIMFDEFLEIGRGSIHRRYAITNKLNVLGNFKKASEEVFQEVSLKPVYSDSFIRTSFCGLGESILYMTSKADITLCTVLSGDEFKAGNIKESELKDIWENAEIFNYFRKRQHINDSECENCSKLLKCAGGCKAKPVLLEGKFNSPDRWACAFYH